MRPRTSRTSVLLGFAALGVFWGAWGAALPAVQRRSGATDAELGLALLLVGVGALVAMRATGVVIDRVGPRLTPISVGLFGLAAAWITTQPVPNHVVNNSHPAHLLVGLTWLAIALAALPHLERLAVRAPFTGAIAPSRSSRQIAP